MSTQGAESIGPAHDNKRQPGDNQAPDPIRPPSAGVGDRVPPAQWHDGPDNESNEVDDPPPDAPSPRRPAEENANFLNPRTTEPDSTARGGPAKRRRRRTIPTCPYSTTPPSRSWSMSCPGPSRPACSTRRWGTSSAVRSTVAPMTCGMRWKRRQGPCTSSCESLFTDCSVENLEAVRTELDKLVHEVEQAERPGITTTWDARASVARTWWGPEDDDELGAVRDADTDDVESPRTGRVVLVGVSGAQVGEGNEQTNVFVHEVADPRIDFRRVLEQDAVCATLAALTQDPQNHGLLRGGRHRADERATRVVQRLDRGLRVPATASTGGGATRLNGTVALSRAAGSRSATRTSSTTASSTRSARPSMQPTCSSTRRASRTGCSMSPARRKTGARRRCSPRC